MRIPHDKRTTKLYIGGPYRNVNGQPDTDISTLDGTTGAAVGPELTGITGYVDDLQVTPDGWSLIATHSGVPGIGNRTTMFDTTSGSRVRRQVVVGDVQGAQLVGNQVFSGFHDGSKGEGSSRAALYDRDTGVEDIRCRPSFDRFMGAWAVDGDETALVIAGNFSTISGVRVEGFAIFPQSAPTKFAATVWGNEPWRSRDTGVDPGSAWRATTTTTTTTTTTVAPSTYLDDGSDQGDAWNASGFADATWTHGIGELDTATETNEPSSASASASASASDRPAPGSIRPPISATGSPRPAPRTTSPSPCASTTARSCGSTESRRTGSTCRPLRSTSKLVQSSRSRAATNVSIG